jgi:hypothetical protein
MQHALKVFSSKIKIKFLKNGFLACARQFCSLFAKLQSDETSHLAVAAAVANQQVGCRQLTDLLVDLHCKIYAKTRP